MISEVFKFAEKFWWFGIFSVAVFFLTIMVLPLVIIRLPSDYFVSEKADGFISRQKKSVRIAISSLKNIGGVLLLIMGVLMLFMPGQGILTMLAGLSIMNFPGKRNMEIRLASNRKVMNSLNWIRKKGKREKFLIS